MADTATTVIASALYRIGAVPENQSIPNNMVQRGLDILNDTLDEWGASDVYIPYQSSLSLPLLTGVESYTIGNDPSYSLNTNQVIDILQCVINDPISPGVDFQTILLTEQMYSAIPYKQMNGMPSQVLLRNYPTYSEIRFQVRPYENMTAVILAKQRLSRVAITDQLSALPNHFILALKLRIVLALADVFGKTLTPEFVNRAEQTMQKVMAANINCDWTVIRDEIMNNNNNFYYNWFY